MAHRDLGAPTPSLTQKLKCKEGDTPFSVDLDGRKVCFLMV
jgi:hypothetical protein